MNAADTLQFVERYSILILPALVVAEQLGIPLPAVPALLGVGALAATSRVAHETVTFVTLLETLRWNPIDHRRCQNGWKRKDNI